jgi:hypothetical protein
MGTSHDVKCSAMSTGCDGELGISLSLLHYGEDAFNELLEITDRCAGQHSSNITSQPSRFIQTIRLTELVVVGHHLSLDFFGWGI